MNRFRPLFQPFLQKIQYLINGAYIRAMFWYALVRFEITGMFIASFGLI